ncbi:MAG: hypothetical protein NPIRA01_06420 [Nitrospirales bacterium]|nr:MAG: hypothetical protein NPIRA01_06420 [Nitrospirales bacterium]
MNSLHDHTQQEFQLIIYKPLRGYMSLKNTQHRDLLDLTSMCSTSTPQALCDSKQ